MLQGLQCSPGDHSSTMQQMPSRPRQHCCWQITCMLGMQRAMQHGMWSDERSTEHGGAMHGMHLQVCRLADAPALHDAA